MTDDDSYFWVSFTSPNKIVKGNLTIKADSVETAARIAREELGIISISSVSHCPAPRTVQP